MAAWEVAMAEHTARTGYVQKNNPKKPRPIPPKEGRRVDVTDPDSKPVKTATGFIQGYTAQAAATEQQVIVAAELISGANERNRLEPLAGAAETELERAGICERPELVLADAGYFVSDQIEALEARGTRVLCPPNTDSRKAPTKMRWGRTSRRCEDGSRRPRPEQAYRRRQQMVEPVFAQMKLRQRAGRFSRRQVCLRLPRRVASDGRDPQSLEALPGGS